MMRATRLSRALIAVLRDQSINARLRLVPRLAGFAVAVLVALSMAAGLVLSTRLTSLENEGTAAMRDLRSMSVLLAETRNALPDLARADSVVERFHSVARETGTSRTAAVAMRASDARFTHWYVDARRAAQGLAMSDDAETSSSIALDAGYRALAAELEGQRADAERELGDAITATGTLYFRLTLVAATLGTGLLALLLVTAWATARSVDESLDAAASQLDAFARGEFTVANDTMEEGPHARLLSAQRRLGRLMRGHAEVADALASGAFRRATRTRAPEDHIGRALALVAANMEDLAATAHRIARGDLSAAIEPRGAEDAIGHAHAAMSRRIGSVMHEIEHTREMMAVTAQQLRDDAATLTSLTSDDAERLRRTADRLAHTTLQAASNAERVAALEERSEESAAAVHSGAIGLQHSFDDLREMLRTSAEAQNLAREAAALAVRSVTSGPATLEQVESDARSLAERAASTTSSLVTLAARGAHGMSESGVLFDRVDLGIQQEQALVRELGATTRAQATELRTIDHAVGVVHRTVSHSASTARQLSIRVESLSAQTRRLESLVRRFRKRAPAPAVTESAHERMAMYRTPPHAHLIASLTV